MDVAEERMHCMEVWGGNVFAQSHVRLSGLDVWIYSRPFRQAVSGGDVYYLSSCATGRISRILLADVSGHGEKASATANGLRSLMQQYVNYLDQTQFVRKMNQRFAASNGDGQFATAIVGSFFSTNNHLSLNNAGHPPPLLYDAAKGEWRLVETVREDTGDLPLGLDEQSTYSQSELTLGPDDLLLAYTDALMDATDADGNAIEPEGVLQIIREIPVTHPTAIVEKLLDRIGDMSPPNLENDDVTVVLMRPTGELRHLPISRKVTAPIRFVGRTVRSIFRREPIAWPEWSKATVGGYLCDALGRKWRGTNSRPRIPR